MNNFKWNEDINLLKIYALNIPIYKGLDNSFVIIKTKFMEGVVLKKQINNEICFIYLGRPYSSIEEIDYMWGIIRWKPTNFTRYKNIMGEDYA